MVIPTWNGLERLQRCLAALDRSQVRAARVVVVDNGSTDGSLAWLHDARPDVQTVALATNTGFAAAVNLGVSRCDETWVAVLNNDVVVEPTWLGSLLEVAGADEGLGAVGAYLLDAADPTTVDSAGIAWSIARGGRDLERGRPAPSPAAPSREVAMVNAGACLYRRTAFLQVGGFEESFFAYVEDVDLGLRLRAAGWRSRTVPAARGLHEGGATLGHLSARHLELLCRNHYACLLRNVPRRLLLRSTPLLLRDVVARVVRDAVHGHPAAPWRGLATLGRDLPALRSQRARLRAQRAQSDEAWSTELRQLSEEEARTRPVRARRARTRLRPARR